MSLSDDVILEQVEYAFDAAGNFKRQSRWFRRVMGRLICRNGQVAPGQMTRRCRRLTSDFGMAQCSSTQTEQIQRVTRWLSTGAPTPNIRRKCDRPA